MFKLSDVFIILALAISFFVSAYLWFSGNLQEAIFTSIWVPSILGFAIYFKLIAFIEVTKGNTTMIEEMLPQIAIAVFLLLCMGIGLTIYEFKEHIMEREKVRKNKSK